MKKIIFTLSIVLAAFGLQAQQNCFWHENFDATSLDDSVTSYSAFPGTNPGWVLNNRLSVSADNCDSAFIGNGDTVILSTITINLAPFSFVLLDFDHICKIDFFDQAILEASVDGGNNWTQFDACPFGNVIYQGGAPFCAQNNHFSHASYPTWLPASPNAIPDNTWWKHERFDISQLVGNFSDVILRFVMYDSNNPNLVPLNGWKIDNICVTAAPCELTPPTVFQCNPVYQGTVYNLGPYDLCLTATDNSSIASAWLYYTINGVLDSVMMVNTMDSTYSGQIPAVNDSDTVCYYFVVTDGATGCDNTTMLPTVGCIQFIASSGITYPYCDNFDTQFGLWTDSTVAFGSTWQLGTPAFGATTGAHTPPNAWDINLTTSYQNNANAVLYSPVLGPPIPNTKLSFWHNWNTETFWDGTRIEYSVDGGPWTILGDLQGTNSCACEVNWYTNNVNCSNQPAFAGNSGGWIKSEYTFTNTFNGSNLGGSSIQFRYIFCSDASVIVDGYSFDDFCIAKPQPEDAGVATVIQPTSQGVAGDCVPVIVNLQNFGINTLTSFDVYYSIDTGGVTTTFGPYPWTGSLATGASIADTLPCLTLPAGQFNLCSWTSFATDGNHFNDTTCITIIGVPLLSLTSCDDVENGNIGYIATTTNVGTAWQLGTPSYGLTTGAHSGVNAWDINLNTPYGTGVTATLTTPFFDVATAINPSFSFWQNRNVSPTADGMRVEYSVDGGIWTTMGAVGSPNSTNWYNNPNVNFTNFPGWSGNSNGWVRSIYYFNDIMIANPTILNIRFRFVFTSGFPFPVLDGISVDDICVTQPGPNDAGVATISQPGPSGPAGACQPVIVTLTNYGSAPLTSFDIYYVVDSAGVQTQYGPFAWTGNLAPGDSQVDTLPCFVVPAGVFNICSWTSLTADSDFSNDTSCTGSIGIPVLSLTSCDDMESGNLGYITTTNNALTNWQIGTPAFGLTTGAHSPVNAWDINLNTAYATNSVATLTTPIYDVGTASNPALSFWQNRNISPTNDGLQVFYTVNGGLTWPLLDIAGGNPALNWYNAPSINFTNVPGFAGPSNGWQKSTFFLQNILNNNPGTNYMQFRFVFTSGFPFPLLDGVSIDDICVTQPGPNDAGVTQFTSPAGGNGSGQPCGNTSPVQVVFFNYGSATITQTNIVWALNGVPVSTTSWSGTIAPGAFSPAITLDSSITYPCGPFTLCAYTQLVSDGDVTNDTTCIDLIGIPTIPLSFTNQFCDNFDGPNNGWTVVTTGDPGTNWQVGTPAFGATNSPHSAPNSWDINLNTSYTNNAGTYLYSPFFDFQNAVNTKMSFWVNFNTEQNWDGVRLEYNKNNTGWTVLTSAGLTFNWYNMPNINCSALPAWAGNSSTVLQNAGIGGWAQVRDSGLAFLNGPNSIVQFRFFFCSDASVLVDGFSLDDFCLEVPVPLTAAPTSCNNSSNPPFVFPGQTIQFNSNITNKGTTPLTSVITCVIIDGSIVVSCDTINFSPALTTNQFQNHVFSNTWVTTPGVHNYCITTTAPNQGVDLNPTDDTLCTCVLSVIDTLSVTSAAYCPDFDNSPQWVTMNSFNYGPNTSWVLGTPNKGFMTSAHTGSNAWVLGGLTTNYGNRDSSALFTPAFNIQSGRTYNLSFWQEYGTEIYQDGGNVEYTIDYGATWQRLGSGGQGPSWYNSFFITALGGTPPQPGFSGTLPVWQNANHDICFPIQNGQSEYPVIFRFRFASDYSVTGLGWVVDDFCFQDMNLNCVPPVGIAENEAAVLSLGQNYPNPTNGSTSIDYTIPGKGKVTLSVTNMIGQAVATLVEENEIAGKYTVSFDANKMQPGIYFYTLTFNEEMMVKKMVITR